MKISQIVEAVDANRIRISDHADLEAYEDRLSYEDIFYSVRRGEIIEEYPTDTPYPSCLVYGQTMRGRTDTQCMGVQSGQPLGGIDHCIPT